MDGFTEFSAADAGRCIAVPSAADDKYSRGVLGMITGSARFPGAAVLGVEAALHTGVGMVRYLGPRSAARLVLQHRPEAVMAGGRVQAWLLGSGIDAAHRSVRTRRRLAGALWQGSPVILDAGALDLADRIVGPAILTPHHGELARLLGTTRQAVAADPAAAAVAASERFGATVLLKGHETLVVGGGLRLSVTATTTWLATAGTGDALAGILGALVATHASEIAADQSMLPRLAATASVLHTEAAVAAGGGGPFTTLQLAAAVPTVIRALLPGRHS